MCVRDDLQLNGAFAACSENGCKRRHSQHSIPLLHCTGGEGASHEQVLCTSIAPRVQQTPAFLHSPPDSRLETREPEPARNLPLSGRNGQPAT